MAYIERKYLTEQFEDLLHNDNVMNPVMKVLDALEIIDTAPTADVEEVKHGEWIAHYNGSLKPIYRCSVCNERLIGYSDANKILYCHCGAKMDGGKGSD